MYYRSRWLAILASGIGGALDACFDSRHRRSLERGDEHARGALVGSKLSLHREQSSAAASMGSALPPSTVTDGVVAAQNVARLDDAREGM